MFPSHDQEVLEVSCVSVGFEDAVHLSECSRAHVDLWFAGAFVDVHELCEVVECIVRVSDDFCEEDVSFVSEAVFAKESESLLFSAVVVFVELCLEEWCDYDVHVSQELAYFLSCFEEAVVEEAAGEASLFVCLEDFEDDVHVFVHEFLWAARVHVDVVVAVEVADRVQACFVGGCVIPGVSCFVEFVDANAAVCLLLDHVHDLDVDDLVRHDVVHGSLLFQSVVRVKNFCDHDGALATPGKPVDLHFEDFIVCQHLLFFIVVDIRDVGVSEFLFVCHAGTQLECQSVQLIHFNDGIHVNTCNVYVLGTNISVG